MERRGEDPALCLSRKEGVNIAFVISQIRSCQPINVQLLHRAGYCRD